MPLRAHLRELRRRATIAAIAILVAAIAGFLLSDLIIAAAAEPIHRIESVDAAMNFTTIGGPFELRFKVALAAGLLLSSPVWLYQIWAYVVPGMTRRERRMGIAFVMTAVPLFVAGAYAGWSVLPNIVLLLSSFAPDGSSSFLTAAEYFDFLIKLVIAVGLGFVAPLALVAFNAAGVISAATILRGWRVAVVIVVIFTATVTPAADVLSMVLLAIPMVGLYFAAYGWCALHDRRVSRAQARLLGETT